MLLGTNGLLTLLPLGQSWTEYGLGLIPLKLGKHLLKRLHISFQFKYTVEPW